MQNKYENFIHTDEGYINEFFRIETKHIGDDRFKISQPISYQKKTDNTNGQR